MNRKLITLLTLAGISFASHATLITSNTDFSVDAIVETFDNYNDSQWIKDEGVYFNSGFNLSVPKDINSPGVTPSGILSKANTSFGHNGVWYGSNNPEINVYFNLPTITSIKNTARIEFDQVVSEVGGIFNTYSNAGGYKGAFWLRALDASGDLLENYMIGTDLAGGDGFLGIQRSQGDIKFLEFQLGDSYNTALNDLRFSFADDTGGPVQASAPPTLLLSLLACGWILYSSRRRC
jgi:hypothetical protein